MGQRTSIYLSDELAAAVKADGRKLADIIAAGLAGRDDTCDRKRDEPRAAGSASPRGAQPPGPQPESAADMAAFFRGRAGS
jgi:hypothetical protein